MKKLFLLSLCTCISLSYSFSQTSKGTKFWLVDFGINGSINESSKSSNSSSNLQGNRTEKNNGFSIAFNGGKFIKNNIAHGIGVKYLCYNNTVTDNTFANNYKDYYAHGNTFQLGYFISRFIPLSSQFYFYGQVNPNFYYSYYKSKYDNSDEKTQKQSVIAINANVGMRYSFKNNFFIDATTSLGNVSYFWANYQDVQESSGFGVSNDSVFSNFSLGIGKSF